MMLILFGLLALDLALWAALNVVSGRSHLGARVMKPAAALALGWRCSSACAVKSSPFRSAPRISAARLAAVRAGRVSKRTQKSGGQGHATTIDMALDHDSGEMRGRSWPAAIRGRAGASIKTLVALLNEVDDESRALLLPYLDRRDARWSEYAQADAATSRPSASSGKMSEQEAYQILGLEAGASADAIGHAHRTLMKKFHPDQGGSTYLAARINEAKETLLRRHR